MPSLDSNYMTEHPSTGNDPMILFQFDRIVYTVNSEAFYYVLNLLHTITNCILFKVRSSSQSITQDKVLPKS